MITCVIPSVLNKGGGEKKLTVNAGNIPEAILQVSKEMGDDFTRRVLNEDNTIRSLINVYVNGKNSKFSGDSLKDGDELYILPAVAGGSDLSSKDLDRYSRQVMLEEIGYNGQLKLGSAKVCVVGTGGLGNPIITRLAAMGVGTIRLVDRDIIELSNLHRQTLFNEDDVGDVKVEAATKHLKKLNSSIKIEALAVSVNEYNAVEIVEGFDVIIDALDSVNARYALNKACVQCGIPFVTGAAVGVSGQVFTILPKTTACYFCLFPALDEDSMPTCSIEGVHPPILSIVGAIEVAEAVKIILGKTPNLSERILHIDLEHLDFTFTRTSKVDECPICGSGSLKVKQVKELIVEELCGRERGKRTFCITPTVQFDLDVDGIAGEGFTVDKGDLGVSLRNDDYAISFMNRGSAVVVGAKDEQAAIVLYKKLLKST